MIFLLISKKKCNFAVEKDITMENDSIKLFESKQIRTAWDEAQEKWYFSVVDVIEVLTDTDRPRKYWSDLKSKLQKEGSELSAKIGQLKLQSSDGKKYLTDVADSEQLLRLIQSIPSKTLSAKRFFENQKPTLPFEEDQSEDQLKDEDKDK